MNDKCSFSELNKTSLTFGELFDPFDVIYLNLKPTEKYK